VLKVLPFVAASQRSIPAMRNGGMTRPASFDRIGNIYRNAGKNEEAVVA
jgi:hypothetical protein